MVEGLHRGYRDRGMVIYFWASIWYLDMLGEGDASTSGVLMQWGTQRV